MQPPRWSNKCPVSPDDLAFLIHAGGTTDIPKGAVPTHHNILINIARPIAWIPVLHEGAEVFYCVLSLLHAFGSTIGLPAGLRLGASVVLFSKFDTTMILTSQKRLPYIFFPGVPPMYERLFKTAETMDVDLSSMTLSLLGAIPLSGELAKRWEEATGGLMVESCGMTEASPIILGSSLPGSRRPGVLGTPSPPTQVRIADPGDPGVDVPEDGIGGLIVKGPQVFSSYWERPEKAVEALWNG